MTTALLKLNKFLHVERITTDVDAVINDLYKFIDAWYAARLKLGPDQLPVERDFERTSGDELTFNCVAEEEQHETRVSCVLPGPVENLWRLNTDDLKWIDSKDDTTDQSEFNKR